MRKLFYPKAIAATLLHVLGCSPGQSEVGPDAIGDALRGKRLATQYGCATCHTIPELGGASVGPPLDHFAERVYAGGRLNTPEHLVKFIMDPAQVDPDTPMPNVGVSEPDARDLAAFLYSLR